MLPEAFLERMQQMLGKEYTAFLETLEQEKHQALRLNSLKRGLDGINAAERYGSGIVWDFAHLEKVPWAETGYYYQACDQPGKHPFHEAGLYYIQEPSAMAPAELLEAAPGDRVLDLCAAPGGKSTQIAAKLQGGGILFCNEIHSARAKILSENIERMGICNACVTNETPERLAEALAGYFDKILVDAPCSGEGMFRKDETAVEQWSEAHVSMCADRQLMILEEAVKMLKPGGVLVYSTCTFAPEENEGTVSRFLHKHGEFRIEEVPHDAAFAPGQAAWVDEPAPGIMHTMRLWPHRLKGEGHYIARLRREGALSAPMPQRVCHMGKAQPAKAGRIAGAAQKEPTADLQDFLVKELGLTPDWLSGQRGRVQKFGEQIYLVPVQMISMQGIKVLRPGLHLATEKKNRLEPAHALALALKGAQTDKVLELSQEEAQRYLRGESLSGLTGGEQKGWTLLCRQGYPLGFGKASGGQMKNHYPKGLRRSYSYS